MGKCDLRKICKNSNSTLFLTRSLMSHNFTWMFWMVIVWSLESRPRGIVNRVTTIIYIVFETQQDDCQGANHSTLTRSPIMIGRLPISGWYYHVWVTTLGFHWTWPKNIHAKYPHRDYLENAVLLGIMRIPSKLQFNIQDSNLKPLLFQVYRNPRFCIYQL